MKKHILIILVFLASTAGYSQSTINLHVSPLFSDYMVVQQKMHFPVWGTATPFSTVQVLLAGFTATTMANSDGQWMVRLPELNAGGPYEMEIIGSNEKIMIRDVMVGEVWFAAGQSNMEYMMVEGIGDSTQQ